MRSEFSTNNTIQTTSIPVAKRHCARVLKYQETAIKCCKVNKKRLSTAPPSQEAEGRKEVMLVAEGRSA